MAPYLNILDYIKNNLNEEKYKVKHKIITVYYDESWIISNFQLWCSLSSTKMYRGILYISLAAKTKKSVDVSS